MSEIAGVLIPRISGRSCVYKNSETLSHQVYFSIKTRLRHKGWSLRQYQDINTVLERVGTLSITIKLKFGNIWLMIGNIILFIFIGVAYNSAQYKSMFFAL